MPPLSIRAHGSSLRSCSSRGKRTSAPPCFRWETTAAGRGASAVNSRRVTARDNSRLGVLVPSGDRSGPTEPAGETLAAARAHRTTNARARPSAWAVNSRPGVLVPSGDRSGPTEPAGETLASLVLIERLAHVRARGEFLTFANTAPPIVVHIKIN